MSARYGLTGKIGLMIGMAALAIFLFLGLRAVVCMSTDFMVIDDAERKAEYWAHHLVHSNPDLQFLVADGQPGNKDIQQIKAAARIGNVFSYAIFNNKAEVVLACDRHDLSRHNDHASGDDHQRHYDLVLDAIISKNPVSELADHHHLAGFPDVFVEVYVPVFDKFDNLYGVFGITFDQTKTAAGYQNLFTLAVLCVFGIVVFAFILPFLAFMRKTRQEKNSSDRAKYLARYDQVAGLYNRAGLLGELDKHLKAGRINPDHMAIVFVDIDHFKAINDTYGHKAGDAFLSHVGACIGAMTSGNDLAGRLGGDEFMLVIERERCEDVLDFVRSLQGRITAPVNCDGATITGHTSIGVDYQHGVEISLQDRMRQADFALYRAKHEGRDTFRLFTQDMEDAANRRRMIEAAILSGQEDERFEVHFQPLMKGSDHSLAGFEALMRLKDRDGKPISPDEFIPIAEEMGQIPTLGKWVLQKSLEAACFWPEHLFVSVNLSAHQFEDGYLVDTIRDLLQDTGICPSRLELEMTESLLMENTDSVSCQLSEIRALGVSLAMDDFGTGYSSLGYLWQFGFDKIKIDRSFIAGLETNNSKTREILDTIVMLGHRLDMTVTAEGIETAEQARQICELKCDYLQGYHFSKPLPPSELPAYMLSLTRQKCRETADVTYLKDHRAG